MNINDLTPKQIEFLEELFHFKHVMLNQHAYYAAMFCDAVLYSTLLSYGIVPHSPTDFTMERLRNVEAITDVFEFPELMLSSVSTFYKAVRN